MKRTVLLAILGIAASGTAFGQGGIIFNNSFPDGSDVYHPIVWDASIPTLGGTGLISTQGVVVNVWFGRGAGLTADQLLMGPAIAWNAGFEAAGYYGYYQDTQVSLPTYVSGDTFTFQLRASGDSVAGVIDSVASRSVLWQESANIGFTGGTPAGLPGSSNNRIGLTVSVPEPTTLAMLGLGMAALVTLRRRS